MMIDYEQRWLVKRHSNGICQKPVLQYRKLTATSDSYISGIGYADQKWTEWEDVPKMIGRKGSDT